MLKRLLKGIGRQPNSAVENTEPVFSIEEQGLCYPLSLADNAESWPLASYLDQLEEEEFVSQLSDRWLLTWDELYRLLDDPDHLTSLPLLGLPPETDLIPQLSSQGSLASDDFKVAISGWRDPRSNASVQVQRTGAIVLYDGTMETLPESSWKLTGAVRQLYLAQQNEPGEVTNQIG